MTDLPRLVAESDVGSIAKVELWRKNKTIIIKLELGELPEQAYVQNNTQKRKNNETQNSIISLGIAISKSKDSKGIVVSKVNNEDIKLQVGDIILEVNRENVNSVDSFVNLINKFEKTGRSSLLLKIKRGEETSWVTIKFINN